jgi:hypothetical protein
MKYYLSDIMTNDGSKIIMTGEGDDRRPIAHVLLQTKVKRGEAWRAECPVRDANAERILALLNGGE